MFNNLDGFAYFVTVCVQGRLSLLGEKQQKDVVVADAPCGVGNKILLNDAGRMVCDVWQDIPKNYDGVMIDDFVVMPDHFHGIIILCGRPQGTAPTTLFLLSDIMHRFKSLTTTLYCKGVYKNGWKSFQGRLWQPGYHECSICSKDALFQIRQYIKNNPK